MSRASFCIVALSLVGCWNPGSPSHRLAESAYDMNTATRFGRMDVALEHVGSQAREAFAKKHSGWGKSVRIVDLEFGGMNLKNKGNEADVFVTVTWQRFDEADVRVTSVTQRWTDVRGTWSLMSEEEKGGDAGLLAEAGKALEAPSAPARASYRTRVIQSVEE
jgi:hypothetical protein